MRCLQRGGIIATQASFNHRQLSARSHQPAEVESEGFQDEMELVGADSESALEDGERRCAGG